MRALTFQGKQDIRFSTVDDPQMTEDHQVVIRVLLSALCGSDLHVYHGRENPDKGTVMGHEAVGEVVAAGKSARKFGVGDRVFSPFFTCCGDCFYCHEELSCRCERGHLYGWMENGHGLQGLQAEYALIPLADSTLYHAPDWLTDEQALLLCDIFPTGYFCADMAFSLPGYTYVVVGCGPVGLMAINSLRLMKAENIVAIDLNAQRLQVARKLGAVGFSGDDPLLAEKIRDMTDGRGADAVLEVVGNVPAQKLAMELVRPGGRISVVGVHHSESFAFPPGALYDKNIRYQTGRCPVQKYVPHLMQLFKNNDGVLTDVITHRLPLSEGPEGYRRFARREPGMLKTVLHNA